MGKHKISRKSHILSKRKDRTPVQISSDLTQCSELTERIQMPLNEENEFEFWRKKMDKVTWDESGGYALQTADVEPGNVDHAKLFLRPGGLDVDRQTKDGRSALMLAAKRSHKGTVECLLESGANVLLEDRLGATALCFAFSQEQMEIAEILQRHLSFKDRDVYVKRRVELLHKPRHNNSRQETANFCKRVLFRVLLKIKKAMPDGVQLLVRHRVFPALLLCSDSNLVDGELQRLVFHLSACLMYGEGETALVVEEVAGHFVEAKGPDFCVRAMQEMSEGERWIALLPVHACVKCPAGRQWLKENCLRISEYTAGFRDAMPDLRYWTTDEHAKAEIMLLRFEEAVAPDTGEDPAARTSVIRDNGLSEASSIKNPDHKFVSNSNCMNLASLAKKKKIVLRHKFRKIKFNAKNQTQHHQETNPKAKLTLKPGFQLPPNSFIASSSLNPNSLTAYADALKKNLSSEIEGELKMDEDITMITIEEDSPLTQKPIQLIDEAVSYSPVTTRGQRTNQEILKSPKYEETENNTGKVCPIDLVNTIRDGYNFWSQVPILTEYSRSNSSFRESTPSPIPQNSYVLPKWGCVRSYHLNELQRNSESLPVPSCQNSSNPFEWVSWCDGLAPSPPIGQSLIKNFGLQLGVKLTAEDEEILCRQFNDLALDDELGSKSQLDDESGWNSKDKSRRKSVVSDFLSEEGSEKPNSYSARDSGGENTLTQNEAQMGKMEAYEISRRTYSDVTRGEDSFKSRRSMTANTYMEDVKTKIAKGPRRYSDVTRLGLSEVVEINSSDEMNRNDIQNARMKDFSFHIKPGEVQTNSHGDHLLTETYLEQFGYEISKEQFAKSNNLSNYIPEVDFSLRDFEVNCLEAIYQATHLKDMPIDKSDEEFGFEAGEVLHNQDRNPMVQQRKNNFSSPLWGDGDFFTHTKNLETVSNNTEWKDAEKSTCLVNSKYRKKKSKKISTKAVRHLLLENLTICPVTLKLNSEILTKNAPLFQLSVPHQLHSSNCQPEIKTSSNLVTLCRDFEKTLSLKNGILPKHKSSNTLFAVGTKYRNSSSENGQGQLNDFKMVGFLNNLMQFLAFKTLKSSDSLPKKAQSHSLNRDPEQKRRESKDKALIKRRIPVLDNDHNAVRESQLRFLDTGYVCRFVNCQTDSKWFPILKGLQSCVPLSQHLLPPTEIPRCSQTTDLCSIYSKAGKIVFSTKLEHTLREGIFGTYIGVLEDGSPVVVRQLSSSTVFKDITALNHSRKHLLKHKNLTILYDAQINLKDLTMSLIYELCEYSLPEYLKMRRSCKFRTMAPPTFFRKLLIVDLLEGIRYLHEMKAVHGFLKPSNLMVTIDDRLKLTDYHLFNIAPLTWGTRFEDPKQSPIGSSISKYCWRPTELIKAENATEARASLTTASDVQICGMLVFYLLSDGRHPFGSTDHTCQENIKLGTRIMGAHPEDTESRDLICEMIKGDPAERPTIEVVLRHPYFWDKEKRFKFLLQVGNKVSFYTRVTFPLARTFGTDRLCVEPEPEDTLILYLRVKDKVAQVRQNRAADDFRRSCIEARNWISNVQRDLMKFISMCTNITFRNEFSDLLQFSVALQDNFEAMPHSLKTFVQQPSHYILLRFPTLFMSIYYVVRYSPLLITQMGLQHFF